MARLPIVDEDDLLAPAEARTALLDIKQTSGRVLNIHRVMANHPKLLRAFTSFARDAYATTSLTRAQRELAYLSATVANNCHY